MAGIARIALVLRSSTWREAAPAGLTATQAGILHALAREGDMRLAALASLLGVSAATASDAVASLERKRLLKKKRAGDDARALAIALTPAGRNRAAAMTGWPPSLLAAIRAMPAAEQTAMLAGLARMIRSLQQAGEIPLARMCVFCRFFRPNAHGGEALPHHCDYVNAPFGLVQIRLDCPEFGPAPGDGSDRVWEQVFGGVSR